MMNPQCPICAASSSRFYRLERHQSDALRCSECRFIWLSPPLRESDADYEDHYRTPDYVARIQSDIPKFERHIRDIEKIFPLDPRNGKRVIEIGSSFGAMMQLLANRGFEIEGIELLDAGVACSRSIGLTIHQTPLEKFESAQLFDIALSTHVVEHLRSIRDYFEKTSQLLRPGGQSIFLTPNSDALFFRLLRRFWAGATPNEHNLFLGRRSVEKLAGDYGFEVVSITTTGRYWTFFRGILSEIWHSRRSSPKPLVHSPREGGPQKSAHPSRTGRDRLFSLLAYLELPVLFCAHLILAPFGLSDELLVVLKKLETPNHGSRNV